MSLFLEYVAGTFASPRATLAQVAGQRPLGAAAAAFVLGALLSTLTAFGSLQAGLPGGAGFLILPLLAASLLLGLAYWVIRAAVLHFFAEVLGGRGSVLDLFACLPFATLPGAVLGVLGSLAAAVAAPWAALPFSLGAMVWGFILHLYAVAAAGRLSLVRSAAALLLPLALVTAGLVVMLLVGLLAALPFMLQMAEEMPGW